jgi:hypothetical protein
MKMAFSLLIDIRRSISTVIKRDFCLNPAKTESMDLLSQDPGLSPSTSPSFGVALLEGVGNVASRWDVSRRVEAEFRICFLCRNRQCSFGAVRERPDLPEWQRIKGAG